MNRTPRLGLKIVGWTALVLCLALVAVRPPSVTSPEILVQLCHSGEVSSLAWSPDGKTLASGSWDGTVTLWDVGRGGELRTLGGHSSLVTSVAWSPDGKTLAGGSWDGTVTLWDVRRGGELRTLGGHSGAVSSVAWSPNGKTLASGSLDKTVKLWDGVVVPDVAKIHDLGLVRIQWVYRPSILHRADQ